MIYLEVFSSFIIVLIIAIIMFAVIRKLLEIIPGEVENFSVLSEFRKIDGEERKKKEPK